MQYILGMEEFVEFFATVLSEISSTWSGLQASDSNHLMFFIFALLLACVFEFINGFHDTANAVATVIYTRSLKPWIAVVLSGVFNFLGVVLGGTAVAMGIIKLLPVNLLAANQLGVSIAMVFALLSSAILWNFGTWFVGLPASSSHTLIGAILGIGLANAFMQGESLASGVNWSKAGDIGLALLISPLIGFTVSALVMYLSRKVLSHPDFHRAPKANGVPPLGVRSLLIGTSCGVSFTHGSNDGQKGIGLIMLVLIAILPAQFALRTDFNSQKMQEVMEAAARVEDFLNNHSRVHIAANEASRPTSSILSQIQISLPNAQASTLTVANVAGLDFSAAAKAASAITSKLSTSLQELSANDRMEIRAQILNLDQGLSKAEKVAPDLAHSTEWKKLQQDRKQLKSLVDYSPNWVILMVALALGIGTMVGWKGIVVTVGEKIGKAQLTYAQGASAQLVAMSTIGLSAYAGLPVSTTQVLASGIAGTMVAGKAGLQKKTIRNIALAWILTFPVSMLLSAGLFLLFYQFI